MEIHDAGEIKPAFGGGEVGDVGHPDLVGGRGCGGLGEAVRSDRMVVVAVGGPQAMPAPLAAAEARLFIKRAMRLRP